MREVDLAQPEKFMIGLRQSPYTVLNHTLDLIHINRELAIKILVQVVSNSENRLNKEEWDTLFYSVIQHNFQKELKYTCDLPDAEQEGKLVQIGERLRQTRVVADVFMRKILYKYVKRKEEFAHLGLENKGRIAFGLFAKKIYQKSNFLNLTSENMFNQRVEIIRDFVKGLLNEEKEDGSLLVDDIPRVKTLLEKTLTVLELDNLHEFICKLVYALPQYQNVCGI